MKSIDHPRLVVDQSSTRIMDDKTRQTTGIRVGAYEAKTKFSELIARAEKGESFLVTKNGRPVARITPVETFDQERARQVVEQMRQFRELQGPPVSEEESQRNYEETKRLLDAEDEGIAFPIPATARARMIGKSS